jgi:hypothetical protein
MRKLSAISAAVVALGTSVAPLQAAAVVVSQNINLGTLLSTGQSMDVQFNIGSLLASNGFSSGDVVSANLIVYGLSDAQYGAATAQPYGSYQYSGGAGTHTGTYYYSYSYPVSYSYSCGFWGWSTCYATYYATGYATGYTYVQDSQYTRDRDILHKDTVADTMQVTAGASTSADVADQVSSSASAYGSKTLDHVDYGTSSNSPYYYYYNRERDVYEAVTGPLEVAMTLDATALSDLSADGIFDISIAASVGQFRTQMASLSFSVEQQLPGNSVPEPGTLALAGVALAAAAGRRRIKK